MTRSEHVALMTWLSDLESQLGEFGELAESAGMPLEVESAYHRVGLAAGRLTAWAVESYAQTQTQTERRCA